jgi:predicted nuclease with TOPRIM domain
MPTVEERLTSLEARVESMSDLRNIITELRGDMNGRFTDVDHRFTELRADMNLRFAQVNGRFSELRDDMNLRFSEVTARFDGMQADVSRRFWDLDQKIDRHFTWLVGTQIAMFLAVVGALIGALYR